ncbi:MAG: DUF1173 domain-containing protein, partial [Candidatus Dormibacteraeota bacterium]|nr:DUF1173 domain-containing protein [Candidatus Dormibacteraeota bacterium]
AKAYGDKSRPLCMCMPAVGVPMYVSRFNDRFLVKRMPYTGSHHHPDCVSYEPPPELSGLGEVAGAIQEDVDAGSTALKLDFKLSKIGSRSLPISTGPQADSVRTDGSRLSLRGTLHYLWEQAQLNRWTPAMGGKRSWYVVRKHLLQAAADKTAKGFALTDLLFIPESFSVDHKAEIEARRIAKLARTAMATAGGHQLMLLIGEVKAIEPARYGHKITIKHLPDMPLLLSEDLYQRIVKRFAHELALWSENDSIHLLAVATFGMSPAGVASLEEICLAPVSANWIPIEHHADAYLLEQLTHAGRRFTKGLRYNLASDRPLAAVVLSDTAPTAVALYLVPPSAGDAYRQALDQLIEASELTPWVWKTGEQSMPTLPPCAALGAAPSQRQPAQSPVG